MRDKDVRNIVMEVLRDILQFDLYDNEDYDNREIKELKTLEEKIEYFIKKHYEK